MNDSKSVSFAPSNTLSNGVEYTLNVRPNIRDLIGKNLASSYSQTFVNSPEDKILKEKEEQSGHKESRVKNTYLFHGRTFDPISGLYYYRARYLHPELGRFLQTDPMGYEDSMNMYQAFSQNPINFVDPFGEEVWGACAKSYGALLRPTENKYIIKKQWRAYKLFLEGISNAAIQTFLLPAKYMTLPLRIAFGFDFNVGVNYTGDGSILQGGFWKKKRLDIVKEQTVVLPLIDSVKQVHEDIKSGNLDNTLRNFGSIYFSALFWSKVGNMIKAEMAKVRGLGDSKTSPWLADKRVGIRIHLEEFREGGSWVMTKQQYRMYVKGKKFIGDPSGQFITSKSAMEKIFKAAKGDISFIEKALGFEKGYFFKGGGLVRIDVKNPLLHNAKFASGLERGANKFFRWGGYTSGGLPECIIEPVKNTSRFLKIMFFD
jgi:RHS repeat-associated protein